jgi:hypothetical protein
MSGRRSRSKGVRNDPADDLGGMQPPPNVQNSLQFIAANQTLPPF